MDDDFLSKEQSSRQGKSISRSASAIDRSIPMVSRHPVAFGRPSARTRQGPSFPGEEDGFDLASLPACSPACPPENKTIETHGARGNVEGERMWGAAHGQTVNEPSSPNPLPFHLDRSSRGPRRRSAEVGRLRRAASTEVVPVRPLLPGVPRTLDQDNQ